MYRNDLPTNAVNRQLSLLSGEVVFLKESIDMLLSLLADTTDEEALEVISMIEPDGLLGSLRQTHDGLPTYREGIEFAKMSRNHGSRLTGEVKQRMHIGNNAELFWSFRELTESLGVDPGNRNWEPPHFHPTLN